MAYRAAVIHTLWLGTLNEFEYPTTSTQGRLTFDSLEVGHGPVVCYFPKPLALLKKVPDLAFRTSAACVSRSISSP